MRLVASDRAENRGISYIIRGHAMFVSMGVFRGKGGGGGGGGGGTPQYCRIHNSTVLWKNANNTIAD